MLVSPRLSRRLVQFSSLLLLAGASLPISAADSDILLPEDVIPLLKAELNTALDVSPTLLIRKADAAASLADLDSAKSMRLPNFGGWAQYSRARDDRDYFQAPQASDKIYYAMTLRQPLYYWGSINRTIQSSKIRTEIDKGDTREAYLTFAQNVRARFLELVMARRTLDRARFGAQLNDAALEEALEKRKQNLNSEADVFQADLKQQRGQLAVAQAEDALWAGVRVFARLTGNDELTEDEIPTDLPSPDLNGDAVRITALMARFLAEEFPENSAIEKARLNLEISHNDLKNTRVSLRPKVDLVAGLTQDEQQFAVQNDTLEFQSTYVGISLTWTLFDGFATKARVKSSLQRIRAAEIRLAQEQEKLVDDVESLGRQLKRIALTIALDEQELESAKNHLEYTESRASLGEASEAEVDVAKLGLSDALGKSLYGRYEYWNKMSALLGLIEADPILEQLPAHVE